MDNSTIEYIIKPKNKGRRLLYKVLGIGAVVILFLLSLLVAINLLPLPLLIPAFLLLLSVAVALCYILLRLISIEYEISIGRNEISIVSIHGKSFRRPRIDLSIPNITEIGVYDDAAYERLCNRPIQKSVYCVSDFEAPDIYYALFELDGELGMLCFEADERAISRLKSLNPRAARQGSL